MAKMTPVGAIGKWVLVPLGCALVGYFLIGPRIEKMAGVDMKKPESPASIPAQTSTPGATNGSAPGHPQQTPDVEVTVQASNETGVATNAKSRRSRTRKTPSKPAETQPSPPALTPNITSAPPDDGGSAGSTTAGGQV